jgi:hypothetical protein
MRQAAITIAIVMLSMSCGGGQPIPPLPIDESAPPPVEPTAVVAEGVRGAQRALPMTLDVDGDGTVGSHTDALLILRYVAGFEGQPLIEGAVGPDCKRCTAEQIAAYIASL